MAAQCRFFAPRQVKITGRNYEQRFSEKPSASRFPVIFLPRNLNQSGVCGVIAHSAI
jgi:hypothetical protein